MRPDFPLPFIAMEKCHILLLDEHPLLMEGVRHLLSPHPDMRIVGMAASIADAQNILRESHVHLVIMETLLRDSVGVEAVRCVRDMCPTAKIIIYTRHTDQRFLLELIHLGIYAHVTKNETAKVLLQAVQHVRQGYVFLSSADYGGTFVKSMQQRLQSSVHASIDTLSPREKEVFLLLADGKSIQDMAKVLHISPKTVESHKYNIFTKLHIHSVSEITKIAIRLGLVHI